MHTLEHWNAKKKLLLNLELELASQVWKLDSDISLGHFHDIRSFSNFRHLVTVKIGFVAATRGGHVTITDLSDFIPLIERNKKQNLNCFKDENVQVAELDWKKYHDKNLSINGATTDPFYNKDYILVSDCIYYERKYALR